MGKVLGIIGIIVMVSLMVQGCSQKTCDDYVQEMIEANLNGRMALARDRLEKAVEYHKKHPENTRNGAECPLCGMTDKDLMD